MVFQMLFFHSKVNDYFNTINESKSKSLLILTTIVMIVTSGIAGIFTEAFNRGNYNYIYDNGYYNNSYSLHFGLRYEFFVTSVVVQLAFVFFLLQLQKFIYTNNEIKTNLKTVDIILIEQMIILKDIIYLAFVFIHMGKIPFSNSSYSGFSWLSDARLVDLMLYMALIIMIMFYLIPKIIPRFETARKDYNQAMLYAIIISFAIMIFVTIGTNIVQTIVDIPFTNY